jgi:hypothetical protein
MTAFIIIPIMLRIYSWSSNLLNLHCKFIAGIQVYWIRIENVLLEFNLFFLNSHWELMLEFKFIEFALKIYYWNSILNSHTRSIVYCQIIHIWHPILCVKLSLMSLRFSLLMDTISLNGLRTSKWVCWPMDFSSVWQHPLRVLRLYRIHSSLGPYRC